MRKYKSKHILIIDDCSYQQVLFKTLLESNGYSAEYTPNGLEALALLKTSSTMPQMILLDLNMPVMGGLTFRQIQRTDPQLKDIPILIISGEEDIQATQEVTNVEVMKKPVSVSSLLNTVDRICKANC